MFNTQKLIQHFFNHILKNNYLKIVRNYSKINFLFDINQRPQRKNNLDFDKFKYDNKKIYFTLGSGYGNILEAILSIFSLKKLTDLDINFIIENKFHKIENLIKFLYQDFNSSEFIRSNDLKKINPNNVLIIILPYTYFSVNYKNKENIINFSHIEMHYDSLYHKEYFSHGLLLEKLFKVEINNNIEKNYFSFHNISEKNNKKKIIGICSGKREGEFSNREYPHFKELVKLLNKTFEVRSFGKKDEYVEGTQDFTNNEFNFVKIYKSMRDCDLIVGTDCGMMHLAERACAKTLWIFGPTYSNKVGPIHGKIIRKFYSCGPCTHTANSFKCKSNSCMIDIEYNSLFQRIISELELKKSKKLNQFDKKEFSSKFYLNYQFEDNFLINKIIKKKKKFPINLQILDTVNKPYHKIVYEKEFKANITQDAILLPIILETKNSSNFNNYFISRPSINFKKLLIFSFYEVDRIEIFNLKKNFLYFEEINYLKINYNALIKEDNLNTFKHSIFHSFKNLGYTLMSVNVYKSHLTLKFREIEYLKYDSYFDNFVFYIDSNEDFLNFEIYCQKYFYEKIKVFPYSPYLPTSRNYKYEFNLSNYKLVRPFKYE